MRLLGGYDWWRYGCDRLAAAARERGFALALLPGECREEDARLAALSTLAAEERAALLACFREGGPENMRRLVRRLARLAGRELAVEPARPLPRAGVWLPDAGTVPLAAVRADGRPVVPILFYRSMLLADDAAPIAALADALAAEGVRALPIYLPSLRDPAAVELVEAAARAFAPPLLVTATAFAAEAEPGGAGLFDRLGVPVLQVVPATTRREAWAGGQRGLAPADLAMHVVLPELDGRILAGAVSFKEAREGGLPAGEPRRAGPRRPGRGADRGAPAARGDAAGGAAHRGPDPRLSRRAGPDRLRGGARRAGERAGAAARPARRRATGWRTCRRPRAR